MAQSVEHVIGNDEVISSNLITSSKSGSLCGTELSSLRDAGMAQSVEHVIGNDEVISSNLITSSKTKSSSKELLFVLERTSLCAKGAIHHYGEAIT